ncbi:DUF1553 domain-containing protein [Roseimicrobium sp. ORNL1]|uniref:DUF1553 domain-containing protein n=1 Tax=Roseimicrobium sp. ORNL1 TaxID=2711231 RepID=UPI0013E120C6|nr:DUF1553 domain-containing protein [Roseimicrobium sp. ORNL1]QIF04362.1 DUF1553 domain-containing protein [Roseimicrobium sp. ORNL1]
MRKLLLGFTVLSSAVSACAGDGTPVSYNFEVKPILAEHCLKCHGQDVKQRKADLRLDDRDNVLAAKSIVPGKPDESELFKRLITHDTDEIMPPPKEQRPLTPEQIGTIRRWIEQGAPYEKHWAFIPPQKPAVPELRSYESRVKAPVDAFVLARLEKEGITPAADISRSDWLRRVTFDLTGLPPTLTELDAFLADSSPEAFEKVTDRLLSSEAYGEHMAVAWLDVARYADTYGRHEDHDCLTWPYRDWVVRAFNTNVPYDKFVLWQTAGDMMPGATQDMYLATAFNRLPQQSNEAGSDEEEFRQDIIADRVRTNGITFMGLSLECARCHDHKYDPISTKDYYSIAAFLNNIDECGLYTVYTDSIPAPTMFVYKDKGEEKRHAEVRFEIAAQEIARANLLPAARERFMQWIRSSDAEVSAAKPLVRLEFEEMSEDKKFANLAQPQYPATVRLKSKMMPGRNGNGLHFRGDNHVSIPGAGDWTRTQAFSTSFWIQPMKETARAVVMHHSRAGLDAGSRGYEVLIEDGKPSFALCHFWPGNAIRIRAKQKLPLNQLTHITATYDGSSKAKGMRMYINGVAADCDIVRDNLYKDITYAQIYIDKDKVEDSMLGLAGRKNDNFLTDAIVDDFRLYGCELSPVEARLIAGTGGPVARQEWFEWYLREKDSEWKQQTEKLQKLRDEENALSMKMQEIMVMREVPEAKRRETHILERGRFDSPTEKVGPDTPASVFAFPPEFPRNRLGYAQWLVDRRNPLTARVFVNRMWQQFFGRGISGTSEDFGIQGELPANPALLDWLAVSFMDNGWDVKALARMLVLSGTYRQSSTPADPALLTRDPDNKLLARGPRVRLTAEELRDNALAVAGLLDKRIGGEPVKPYQPAGLWEDSGTQHDYVQSTGKDLFRRSVYTFWRRTLPPPSMSVFDAPTREFCKARREKSATPLQALVLFNDPQFLEAARVLAEKLVREHPSDDCARAKSAFRILTAKELDPGACDILVGLIKQARENFAAKPEEADALRRKNGEAAVDDKLNAVEVAATTMLTRALLAYDECVMKP